MLYFDEFAGQFEELTDPHTESDLREHELAALEHELYRELANCRTFTQAKRKGAQMCGGAIDALALRDRVVADLFDMHLATVRDDAA